jgi:hypothetical protein
MNDLTSEIRTVIDNATGEPKVVISIMQGEQSIVPVVYTPEEAREVARLMWEASESIEHDAHLIAVLRSRKLSEAAVYDLVNAVRELRETDLNSITIEESQEGEVTD